MVAANDKDLSVCSLNIVISVLLGRVVGNSEESHRCGAGLHNEVPEKRDSR